MCMMEDSQNSNIAKNKLEEYSQNSSFSVEKTNSFATKETGAFLSSSDLIHRVLNTKIQNTDFASNPPMELPVVSKPDTSVSASTETEEQSVEPKKDEKIVFEESNIPESILKQKETSSSVKSIDIPQEESFVYNISSAVLDQAPTNSFVSDDFAKELDSIKPPTPKEEKEKVLESATEKPLETEPPKEEKDAIKENANNEIDYFQFEFESDINKEKKKEKEEEQKKKLTNEEIAEEEMKFDFYNTIRPIEDSRPKLVDDVDTSDNIRITKVLEAKDNHEDHTLFINDTANQKYHRNKSILKYCLFAFYIFLFIFAGVGIYCYIQASSKFTLSRKEISLAINATYQAEVIQNKRIQDNEEYEWTSQDENIATVDDKGMITGLSKGTTTITAKSKRTRKEQELTVSTIDVIVNSVRFKDDKLTLKVGEEKTLAPIINDDESIIVNLDWMSYDADIVQVDANGHITAKKEGTTTIMVQEPNSSIIAEITIVVTKNSKKKTSNTNSQTNSNTEKVAVESISLNVKETTVKVGNSVTVSATIKPSNATNKNISWTTSDAKIATVKNGKITAVKAGTATITAITQDGKKKATVKVTVKDSTVAVTGVEVNKKSLSMNVGDIVTLTATVDPKDASNKNVSWSSSDEDVVTVSKGKVTAKSPGTATITVSTQDGNKKATVKVTVIEQDIPVTDIKLSTDSVTMKVEESKTVEVTLSPSNATQKKLTWTSEDDTIAKVENGKITGVGVGTTTITVTAESGIKVTIQVKVTKKGPDPKPDPNTETENTP